MAAQQSTTKKVAKIVVNIPFDGDESELSEGSEGIIECDATLNNQEMKWILQ